MKLKTRTPENYPHDVCPKCGTPSVPAENVPDQALRGCPNCAETWMEDLCAPASDKSTYDQQAESFLESNGIAIRITLSDSKTPAWKNENDKCGHHYRVTLSKRAHGRSYDNQAKRLVFDFWGSINDAEKGETPSAYDVLACISGDITTCEHFEGFCDEYGYERDSIKALQMFRRCNSFARRLRAFFTEKEQAKLSEIS